MDRVDLIQLMIKEASDSGVIAKHADLPTYTNIWESFERILDIVLADQQEVYSGNK